MLANGKTVREVSLETGLSFTQFIKELQKILPLYVEVKDLERKLLELKDEYSVKIKRYEELKREVEQLETT